MNHNSNMEEPRVSVGIMSSSTIKLELNGLYLSRGTYMSGVITREMVTKGAQEVSITSNGRMAWDGKEWETLCFIPLKEHEADFVLKEVTIGVDFHWQRKEDQRFKGALELIVEEERVTAVNHVLVEDYLTSVISSEMSASASEELLKAHAVISRSWLLASMKSIEQKYPELKAHPERHRCTMPATPDEDREQIKWFERDAHTRFDVCADDHCQRYQGITRASRDTVRRAIEATRGEVLTSEGSICDARFSKCCGGAFEEFAYCWDNIRYPYLRKRYDLLDAHGKTPALPDLSQEEEAEQWIRTAPEAFCNTHDQSILSQVLNSYDQETTDFYRWHVSYTQEELSNLIQKRSGVDYGYIIDLKPIARGTSGRIWKLKIIGTKQSCTIGKELEIRRTLSTSHLYSSAFVVDKEGTLEVEPNATGITHVPARFMLTGAGWGHGVGLCQIGAAVMGARGYDYRTILSHYFEGAELTHLY